MTAPAKILIVDDDLFLCMSLSRLLRKYGFIVETAESGSDAIRRIETHPDAFRLALIDFHMPQMDGEETAQHLKRLSPRLKVVAMTGYSPTLSPDDPDPTRLPSSVYDAFLFKPFENGAILETVTKLCR